MALIFPLKKINTSPYRQSILAVGLFIWITITGSNLLGQTDVDGSDDSTATGGSSATEVYIGISGAGFSLANNTCGTLIISNN